MKKYTPILIFLGLSILIFPFFSKGYFFLLDGPFSSPIDLSMTSFLNTSFYFFLAFFKGLNLIFPLWFIQRVFYIVVIFLLGFGGYKLLEGQTKLGAYFAGILLMFNPYVYARVLDGQMGVVAGVAMCLFFYHFLFRFLQTRRYKDLLFSSLFGTFAIMWTSHSLFFIFGSLLMFFVFDTMKHRNFGPNLRSLSIATVVILGLNANWIIGNIVGNGSLTESIGQISEDHFQAFATDPGKTNLYFNALTLHGFWGERQGRYLPTYFENTSWQVLFCVLFLVIAIGIYARLRNPHNNEKGKDAAFLCLGIIAYILSLGISNGNIFAPVSYFLYEYLPFYAGLREPQKWAGILLIAYAYFGGHGVHFIYTRDFIQKGFPKVIAAGLLCIPILTTPTMLMGFNGQLFVSDYPQEWYRLREYFATVRPTASSPQSSCQINKEGKSSRCYDMISLPWHQYIGLRFARKSIANPGESFFHSLRVLQGDNMEMRSIYTQSTRPESKIIERYIGPGGVFVDGMNEEEMDSFLIDLKGLGIRYILILKESDFKKYEGWMEQIREMGKITLQEDNDALKLFLIP